MAKLNDDEMSNRATSQTDRARWAWEQVVAAGEQNDDYLREVRKLPARLLTSGLGQTMAFLHAKSKGGQGKGAANGLSLLYRQLGERVRTQYPGRGKDAMQVIVGLEAHEYRLLSRELLECAQWLKRLAEGYIKEPSNGARQEEGR